MADLDGDGRRDMITGCWPSKIFIFRGLEGGAFAPAEPLLHKDGSPIEPGRASTVFAADWDEDGDLDLVLGNIEGQISLALNEGSAREWAFGERRPLTAGGKPIQVDGGDAGPCVADWDGDGRADLIVGTGSGEVLWYRNAGPKGKPALAEPRRLVENSKAIGQRTKVAAADYNGDGLLDLLVGDFTYDSSGRKSSPGEESVEMQKAYERYSEQRQEWEKLIASIPGKTAAERAERSRKLIDIQKRMDAAFAEVEKLRGDRASIYSPYRGNVWLFLRKAPPKETARF